MARCALEQARLQLNEPLVIAGTFAHKLDALRGPECGERAFELSLVVCLFVCEPIERAHGHGFRRHFVDNDGVVAFDQRRFEDP
eukprot:1879394-Heterocapsa_arctica.AAC.1